MKLWSKLHTCGCFWSEFWQCWTIAKMKQKSLLPAQEKSPVAERVLEVFTLSVGLTFHCLGWYTHERSFLRGFQQ